MKEYNSITIDTQPKRFPRKVKKLLKKRLSISVDRITETPPWLRNIVSKISEN